MTQTHNLNKEVEALAHDALAAEVKVLNTFNSFLNLSYYQYVENVRTHSSSILFIHPLSLHDLHHLKFFPSPTSLLLLPPPPFSSFIFSLNSSQIMKSRLESL